MNDSDDSLMSWRAFSGIRLRNQPGQGEINTDTYHRSAGSIHNLRSLHLIHHRYSLGHVL
jgi:hypothetical protein